MPQCSYADTGKATAVLRGITVCVTIAGLLLGVAMAPLTAAGRLPAQAPDRMDHVVADGSIGELQEMMARGRTTSRQIVEAYLRRIAAYDKAGPKLNAIIAVNPKALADADALDRERRAGRVRGPLHGVPILVKDNFDVAGMPTSGGSLALATLQATQDAFVVAKLRRAGAVILGKTAMHELALGTTTVSSLTGITRNPYDIRRSPGGSSGGSAVGVAAGFAAAAMGTDTCGSIRDPAAAQNLYGLRETTGLSSRGGILPLSTTQDVPGPIARTVTDLATMMDAVTGVDERDLATTTARRPGQRYVDALTPGGLKGARIGLLTATLDPTDADPATLKQINAALALARSQGAVVVDVVIPGLDDIAQSANVTAFEFRPAFEEFVRGHAGGHIAQLPDIARLGLDHRAVDAVLHRLAAPTDAAAYRKAFDQRAVAKALILDAMANARVDVLAYPVSIQPPLLWGASPTGRAMCRYSASTGLPAIAMPLGLSEARLPVGLELLAPAFAEPRLLHLAYAWEQAAGRRALPSSTPALVGGKAPRPTMSLVRVAAARRTTAAVRFRYAVTTSLLDYDAHIRPGPRDEPIALTLHLAAAGGKGPVVAVLTRRGLKQESGEIYVEPALRDDLMAGRLYVQLFTHADPLGGATAPLILR